MLITQGYGVSKWEKLKIPEHLPPRFQELECPKCHSNLNYTGYTSRDPFTGKRITRCKACYSEIEYSEELRCWVVVGFHW